MIEYAVTYRGVLVRLIQEEPDLPIPTIPETGPDWKVVVMDESVFTDPPLENFNKSRPKKPDFVNKDVFLFEMFSITEQQGLLALVKNIDANADWSNSNPALQAIYFRGLELAQSQLENVTRVQISSPRTLAFLDLIFALGLFGDKDDPAVQLAYVTRKGLFTDLRLPDGTYINEDPTTGEIFYSAAV